MKCKDCKHFKILYEPMRAVSELYEIVCEVGRAVCEKHMFIVDFSNHRKLDKLTCWENEREAEETPANKVEYCDKPDDVIVEFDGQHYTEKALKEKNIKMLDVGKLLTVIGYKINLLRLEASDEAAHGEYEAAAAYGYSANRLEHICMLIGDDKKLDEEYARVRKERETWE